MATLLTSINHNKHVIEFVKTLQAKTDTATTIQDLVTIINDVKNNNLSLKLDHRLHYIVAALCFIAAAVTAIYQISQYQTLQTSAIFSIVILALLFIGALAWIFTQKRQVSNLSDTLYTKNVLIDNQLTQVAVEGDSHAKQLGSQFYEFNRGNYSRTIEGLYQGQFQGNTYSFDYHYYHFHYVDRRTEVTTDSKGRTRTRTIYDHYHRYGIYLPFAYVNNLAILSNHLSIKGERFKPASNRFNKRFKVYTTDQFTAAKFLKPSVVLTLEDAAENLKNINLEFNAQNHLCVSVDDRDVLSLNRQYGIEDPDNFINEIEQHQTLPKLHLILELIHNLMTSSDNNFQRNES